jgi:hypothetical protein
MCLGVGVIGGLVTLQSLSTIKNGTRPLNFLLNESVLFHAIKAQEIIPSSRKFPYILQGKGYRLCPGGILGFY